MGEVDANRPQSIRERILSARRAAAGGAIVDHASGSTSRATAQSAGSRRVPRFHGLILSIASLTAIATGGFVLHKYPLGGEASAQTLATGEAGKTAPAGTNSPTQPDNPFAKHASDGGVQLCNSTYAALGKVLTSGARYMVQTETAKAEADKRPILGIVGMNYQGKQGDYAGPAAGVVFAAPDGNACGGNMVRVVPFSQDCQSVAGLLPKGSSGGSQLEGVAVYALSTGGQAMLLPAQTGCVAVSILRTAI